MLNHSSDRPAPATTRICISGPFGPIRSANCCRNQLEMRVGPVLGINQDLGQRNIKYPHLNVCDLVHDASPL